jgi:hypothetical protein
VHVAGELLLLFPMPLRQGDGAVLLGTEPSDPQRQDDRHTQRDQEDPQGGCSGEVRVVQHLPTLAE